MSVAAFATSSFSKVVIPEVESFCLMQALSKPAKVGSYLDVFLSQPKTVQYLGKLRGSTEISRAESKVIEWTRQWAGRVERKTISNTFCAEYEPEKHFKTATRALLGAGISAYASGFAFPRTPVFQAAILRKPVVLKPAFAPSYTAKVLALYPLFASSPILPIFRGKA